MRGDEMPDDVGQAGILPAGVGAGHALNDLLPVHLEAGQIDFGAADIARQNHGDVLVFSPRPHSVLVFIPGSSSRVLCCRARAWQNSPPRARQVSLRLELVTPRTRIFSLSPRGTSGERVGERGIPGKT